jgi:tetratricopeptide (TPR) repeat protein
MPEKDATNTFLKLAEPIFRKFIENIESPYVWTPLGLFVLCVAAYPVTSFSPLRYLAFAFLILAFLADWVGRWRNRQAPPPPSPESEHFRDELLEHLSDIQLKAVKLLEGRKTEAAQALIGRNLKNVEHALSQYPGDADFHALLGYTFKDVYQSSKASLAAAQRQGYLGQAKKSFERALAIDPSNPSAHNGMGNVAFFEGNFDEAIKEHDVALDLTGGNYTAADHDKRVVLSVKRGDVPFDF